MFRLVWEVQPPRTLYLEREKIATRTRGGRAGAREERFEVVADVVLVVVLVVVVVVVQQSTEKEKKDGR
jgi:hypothetical protein